ncbi:MAG: aminotransferase class I/II-fold pyridoxal phosphate-dependent enzyme [Planctomycetota bacterium]
MTLQRIPTSDSLANVRYEIRGALATRSVELERQGHQIIKMNVGNPGLFGFRAPDNIQRAIAASLPQSDPYSHQKGIMPAREAVVKQQHQRGVTDVTTDDVFIGNGVSELILICLRGLLSAGDEVLIPSPDYPLWTAATTLALGKAVHYPCRRENGYVPDPADVAKLVTPRTRAIVIISPNNPTGAVYPKAVIEQLVAIAEERGLVVFSDEIYDDITYDGAVHTPVATVCKQTLCATFGGLSKVYRSCGYRVGWVSFSGAKAAAKDYMAALDLLCALRLCSNVPGQFAVAPALNEKSSIGELIKPGGRLYETRRAVIDGLAKSKLFETVTPAGALYAFVRLKPGLLPGFDDQKFAFDLLEKYHILVTPGNGFNVPYRDGIRLTLLPEAATMTKVIATLDEAATAYATAAR